MMIYVLFYEEEKGKLTPWTFGASHEEATRQAEILQGLTKSDIYILRMRNGHVFPDYVDEIDTWGKVGANVYMAQR